MGWESWDVYPAEKKKKKKKEKKERKRKSGFGGLNRMILIAKFDGSIDLLIHWSLPHPSSIDWSLCKKIPLYSTYPVYPRYPRHLSVHLVQFVSLAFFFSSDITRWEVASLNRTNKRTSERTNGQTNEGFVWQVCTQPSSLPASWSCLDMHACRMAIMAILAWNGMQKHKTETRQIFELNQTRKYLENISKIFRIKLPWNNKRKGLTMINNNNTTIMNEWFHSCM